MALLIQQRSDPTPQALRFAAPRPPVRGLLLSPAFVLLLLFCLFGGQAPLHGQPSAEYQLKAVFLFNFTQFVEWPREALPDPEAPLVIGILGTDPFGGYLDETVRGERVYGRPLAVRRYRSVNEAVGCHVLFISQSEQPRMHQILAALRGRPVLTVAEMDRFATGGGIVRFLTERNRIRLQINLDAARAANLTISSKLLRAAEIVSTSER